MQASPPLPHGNKNILTVERKKELKARTDVVKKTVVVSLRGVSPKAY